MNQTPQEMNEIIIRQYAKDNPKRDVAVVGLRDAEGDVLLMRTHTLPDLWQPVGGGRKGLTFYR